MNSLNNGRRENTFRLSHPIAWEKNSRQCQNEVTVPVEARLIQASIILSSSTRQKLSYCSTRRARFSTLTRTRKKCWAIHLMKLKDETFSNLYIRQTFNALPRSTRRQFSKREKVYTRI